MTPDLLFDVVLYHKNCFDGMGALWCYRKWLNKNLAFSSYPVFIEMTHDKDVTVPSEVEGKRVLLLDYCFKQDKMDELCAKCTYVLVLDHHESAQNVKVSNGLINLDMKRSGAQIAWDVFVGGNRDPMIDYIGDRDLWNNALPQSKEICAFIYSHDVSLENLDKISGEWDYENYGYAGSYLLAERTKNVKEMAKSFSQAILTTPSGNKYNIKVGDCNWMFRSDVGNYIVESDEKCDFVLLYTYYWNTKSYNISLRGKDKVNLSKLAIEFGGGGHPNASGFSSSNLHDFLLIPDDKK